MVGELPGAEGDEDRAGREPAEQRERCPQAGPGACYDKLPWLLEPRFTLV
jgi:hypothetical protein